MKKIIAVVSVVTGVALLVVAGDALIAFGFKMYSTSIDNSNREGW